MTIVSSFLFKLCGLLLLTAVMVLPLPVQAEQVPRRQIALTFDDAPRGDGPFFTGEERTDVLIAALDEAGVEGAAIFVTTQGIARHNGAGRLRRYTDAGLVLGNHSHTHQWLHRMDPTAYLADIDRASEILTAFDNVIPFYRYPFLDEGRGVERRDIVRTGLKERGLKNGYVTVDTYDWHMVSLADEAKKTGHELDMDVLRDTYVDVIAGSVEYYDEMAQRTLGRSPRHVLLLHENDLAALFVPDLVARLKAQGWDIIPAMEAFRDPIAEVEPDTLFLGQGRIAALAHVNGEAPRDLVHETEDEAYLRNLFIERGLLPAE